MHTHPSTATSQKRLTGRLQTTSTCCDRQRRSHPDRRGSLKIVGNRFLAGWQKTLADGDPALHIAQLRGGMDAARSRVVFYTPAQPLVSPQQDQGWEVSRELPVD